MKSLRFTRSVLVILVAAGVGVSAVSAAQARKAAIEVLSEGTPLEPGAAVQTVITISTSPSRTEFCEITSHANLVTNGKPKDIIVVHGNYMGFCASPPPRVTIGNRGDVSQLILSEAVTRVKTAPPRLAIEIEHPARCYYEFHSFSLASSVPGPLMIGPTAETVHLNARKSVSPCAPETTLYVTVAGRNATNTENLATRFAKS
jgi:hypothetical protein